MNVPQGTADPMYRLSRDSLQRQSPVIDRRGSAFDPAFLRVAHRFETPSSERRVELRKIRSRSDRTGAIRCSPARCKGMKRR